MGVLQETTSRPAVRVRGWSRSNYNEAQSRSVQVPLITNQSLEEKWSDSNRLLLCIVHTDARRPPKSRNLPLTQQIGDVVLLITEEIALTHAAIIPGARLTRQVTRAGEH